MPERFQLCPHCGVHSQFSESTLRFSMGRPLERLAGPREPNALLQVLACLHCEGFVLTALRPETASASSPLPPDVGVVAIVRESVGCRADEQPKWNTEHLYPWKPALPKLSEDVPPELREAYTEAWSLKDINERATAVMARRCLQLTLRKQGFTKRTLDAEIAEAAKTVGPDLAQQLHYVRTLGNIGAHPMDAAGSVSFDQLLDVQPGEMIALFAAVQAAFDEFYVKPAAQKRHIEELNARLKAAGRPPLKP